MHRAALSTRQQRPRKPITSIDASVEPQQCSRRQSQSHGVGGNTGWRGELPARSPPNRSVQQLALEERGVDAAKLREDLMRSLLRNAPFAHHDDPIGAARSRETMRNDEDRAVAHEPG